MIVTQEERRYACPHAEEFVYGVGSDGGASGLGTKGDLARAAKLGGESDGLARECLVRKIAIDELYERRVPLGRHHRTIRFASGIEGRQAGEHLQRLGRVEGLDVNAPEAGEETAVA
ncbi:MAG: hypothetical protein FWD69_17895 [Polyangiaceae bacterium]|nr:hypothetical protein [Polyangiaceae bacterium]